MWSLTRMPAGRPAGMRAIVAARSRTSASMAQPCPYVNRIGTSPMTPWNWNALTAPVPKATAAATSSQIAKKTDSWRAEDGQLASHSLLGKGGPAQPEAQHEVVGAHVEREPSRPPHVRTGRSGELGFLDPCRRDPGDGLQ